MTEGEKMADHKKPSNQFCGKLYFNFEGENTGDS